MREIMRFWDNKLVPQTVCVNTRAPHILKYKLGKPVFWQ